MKTATVTAKLIGMPISPYTERARWALDYCRVPYHFQEHLVMLGMPALRLQTGKWTGDLTVPVLIDGPQRFFDSFDIAQHAASLRSSKESSADEGLFPRDLLSAITEVNALSDEALDAARALTLLDMSHNADALRESVPPFIPKALSGLATPLVRLGVSYLRSEFQIRPEDRDRHQGRLSAALERLENQLNAGGGLFLLGRLTYADFTAAVTLQFVCPAPQNRMPLGPAMRRLFTRPELMQRFSGLLAWRNTLYENYR